MDHRVEASERVRLFRDVAHGRKRRKIADQRRFGQRHGGLRIPGARLVAGMQHDRMPLLGQQPPGHQAEPVRRTGDEDPRHDRAPAFQP